MALKESLKSELSDETSGNPDLSTSYSQISLQPTSSPLNFDSQPSSSSQINSKKNQNDWDLQTTKSSPASQSRKDNPLGNPLITILQVLENANSSLKAEAQQRDIYFPEAEAYRGADGSHRETFIQQKMQNKKQKIMQEVKKSQKEQSKINLPPQIIEKEKPTELIFNGKEFAVKVQASNTLVHFVFELKRIDEFKDKQEVETAALEWDGERLKIILSEEKVDKVLSVFLNALQDWVFFVAEDGTVYHAKISKFHHLHDARTEQLFENPTCNDLFNFLSDCKSADNEEDKPRISSIKPQEDNIVDKKKGILKTSSTLEEEAINNLMFQIRKTELPAPKLRTVSVAVLEHDFSLRNLNELYVEDILKKMNNGTWQNQRNLFVVNKIKNSDSLYVFDGNNVFAALKEFNNENEQQITNVQCQVYEDLDFEQKVLIKAPLLNGLHQPKLTFLETVSLALKIVEEHSLTLPTTQKVVKTFNSLMQMYFNGGYPSICTNIICLPKLILDKLFSAGWSNLPLSQIHFTAHFWKAFIQAVKRDEEEAFDALSLLGQKSIDEIEKLLLAVQHNFLEILRDKAPHDFQTETEAVEFLSSGRMVDKFSLMKHLDAINFTHNRKRPVASKNYWEKLQQKLLQHFQEHALYPNAVFHEQIDPTILPVQNMVITNVLTPSFLELLDDNHANFVILLLSNFGEAPPKLLNVQPTAVFNILMEDGIQIDSVGDSLPPTTISASIYLPEAPENNKVQYLRQLAMEKGCCLGTTITIQKLPGFAKMSSDYDSILLNLNSTKIAELLLQNLDYYNKVTVSGDAAIKQLVAACKPFAKQTKAKEKFDDEKQFEDADEQTGDNEEEQTAGTAEEVEEDA